MQTHSILGDVETKGEKASVRKWQWAGFTGKQLPSRWQEARIHKLVRLCQGATWPLFTSPGRSPGCRRGRDTGHRGPDTARGWEKDVSLPPQGFSNFLMFSVSFTMSLPFSELNSGSQLLRLGAKSNLNHTCRVSYWESHSFPMPNLLQTSPPFSVPEFSWLQVFTHA